MANNILKSIKLGAPTSIEGGASPNTQFSIQSAENVTKVSMKDEDAKCTTKGAFCSASIVVGMKAEEADNGNTKAKSRVNVNIHSTSSFNEQHWDDGFDAVSGLANCITNENGATPTQDSSFSGTFSTPVAAPSQVAAINEWAKTHGGGVVSTDDNYVQFEPKHGADAVMHANDGAPSTKEDWAKRIVYRMADTGELKSVIPTRVFSFQYSNQIGYVEYIYAFNFEKNIVNVQNLFNGQSKLRAIFSTIEKRVNNCGTLFYDCSSIEDIRLSEIFSDMSECVSVSQMFRGCTSLKNISFDGVDLSSVETMQGLFMDCKSLVSVDSSMLNIAMCKNISNMMQGCSSLQYVKMCATPSCEQINNIFYQCSSLTDVDLSLVDTSKCENMDQMFSGCHSLVSLDISNLDTSSATNIGEYTFFCNKLQSIKFSSKFFRCATRETSPLTSLTLHRAAAWRNATEVADTVAMLPDLTTFSDGRTGQLRLNANAFNLLSAQQVADAAAKGWNVYK